MANQPVAQQDVYLDDKGKVTRDPKQAAFQIAFKGAPVNAQARKRYKLNPDGTDASAPAAPKPAAPAPAQNLSHTTLTTSSVTHKASPPAKK